VGNIGDADFVLPRTTQVGLGGNGGLVRRNHFTRTLAVWACASIALLSGSAVLAGLPRHLLVQTLEATQQEIQPIPGEIPDGLQFGQAVAIRNGTAFVGMPIAFDRRGRVAIFTQTASGWQRTGTLTAADDLNFGLSLAFRDGYVFVGASRAVYVFRRGNGGWNLSQRLARPAGETPSNFLAPMHFESGVLLIGAPNATLTRRHGTVYLYELNAAGNLVFRTALTASDRHDGDEFGTGVSVASGVIVIGAPGNFLATSIGAAYVFRRNSSGAWVQRQRLVATETQAGDRFGAAVAIDKGMIVIGAPWADPEGGPLGPPTTDGHIAGGAAYGFVPAAGVFVETFKLRPRPDENADYAEFGRQIEMFDKRIVVAAEGSDFNREPPGFVHTYVRDGSTVTPLGLAAGFLTTTSIALANQWLLVGSPFTFACGSGATPCIGEADVFDLNRFMQ
jgi:hypothetical protein